MNLYVLLVGVSVLVCAGLSRRLSVWSRVLVFLLAIVIALVAGLLALANRSTLMGSEEPWFLRTPWRDILSFTAMTLGMMSKYLWDLIELRRDQNAGLVPGQARHHLEFDFWDFLQPLLVSGIVFSGILEIQKEANPSAFLFSFQNGFFWQTILKSKAQPKVT